MLLIISYSPDKALHHPAYWSGVLLVGFANLRIEKGNWRSLHAEWQNHGREPRSRELDVQLAEELRRYGWIPETISVASLIVEHEDTHPRVPLVPGGAAAVVRVGPALEVPFPRTHVELRKAQTLTRERLDVIAARDPVAVCKLAQSLQTVRLPGGRFAAVRPVGHRISIGPAGDPRGERVEPFLNSLFVETALAGLWPRFARCTQCGRYSVMKRLPSRACAAYTCPKPSNCRVRLHRTRKRDSARARARARDAAVWREFEAYRTKRGLTSDKLEALVAQRTGRSIAEVRRVIHGTRGQRT